MGALLALGAIVILLYFAIIVLLIISWWIVFSKANQPGWAILIPIYNILIMLNVAKKPWWWIFLLFIPVVNIVFAIIMFNSISVNFGKTAGFTVGMVFLPFVFVPILAFSKAQYIIEDKSIEIPQ